MDYDLIKLGAASLKKAALNEAAKQFVLQNENLYKALKRAANRYIGGETLGEAILSIKALNTKGYFVTTDFMGESIRNEKDANAATQEFLALGKAINSENLNSSISLDLSHIGLLVSPDLTKHNLQAICKEAAKSNREVIISMEATDRTDQILDIYKDTLKTHDNLGITVQAYLHRTKDDFKEVLGLKGSIRLVKGAYETPEGLSIPRGNELDEIYLNYADQLLSNNHKCSIASHDEKIHREAVKLIDCYKPTDYLLERLLGICNEAFQVYNDDGYNCRIYLVYGKEWYLYLCNRWAEYPLNLFRGLADIVG
jgi:proline dehydrogenase